MSTTINFDEWLERSAGNPRETAARRLASFDPGHTTWRTTWALTLTLLVLMGAWLANDPTSTAAQDKAGGVTANEADAANISIIHRDPFDRLHLPNKGKIEIWDVEPLNLPGNQLPEDRNAKIRVRRLNGAPGLYDVLRGSIERVEFYEQLVMTEAKRLASEKKYGEAYEFYDFLLKEFPKQPALAREFFVFLFREANLIYDEGVAFANKDDPARARKKFQEAFAVIKEVDRLNKTESAALSSRLSQVIDQLLTGYVDKDRNYLVGRAFLDRIERDFGNRQQDVVDKWRDKMNQLASVHRDDALRFIKAGESRKAHAAVREMLNIVPDVEGGRELAAEVGEKFPLVLVGVMQQATRADPRSMDDWGAPRAGWLTQRLLMEFDKAGPEGGVYVCPLGRYEIAEDQRSITLFLREAAARPDDPVANGYEVSQRILDMADPGSPHYLAAWQRLLAGVAVENVHTARVDFRHPYVMPEALMQTLLADPVGDDRFGFADGTYALIQNKNGEFDFRPNPRYQVATSVQRPQIVEIPFSQSQKAVAALRQGGVDVLDRVPPSDVPGLVDDKSIVVGQYRLPTVHMLVPKGDDPWLSDRNFRRAIVYAINRELILRQYLLNNADIKGCQVISGPFSAGLTAEDEMAYAYDLDLDPLPYDRVMGKILAQVTDKRIERKALESGEEPPKRKSLVLGYPPNEIARIACRSIASHLKAIDIDCKLLELPPGELNDPQDKCDLVYVEVVMWEPVVETRRLLGEHGVVGSTLPHLALGLRRLEAASNWQRARGRLYDLHRISMDDMVVIPLWQLVEHYARRAYLKGVAAEPLSLYQDVKNWRISNAAPE